MKFLVDAQLPPTLTAWIRTQGYDAVHVAGIDLLAADDQAIWARALADARVLLSKDRDFADWAFVRTPFAPVVWIRGGNQTNQALMQSLAKAWSDILAGLSEGARVIEIGR